MQAVKYPPVLYRVPRWPGAVARPRLERRLDGEAAGLLLVGPAGSGKSVLAASLAGHATRAGWVRLAPGYERAADLVGLAAASLGAEPPATVGASLVELAGALLDLVEREPTVLVVDDYQLGVGEECDPLLAEVLPLFPATSSLVVCTRVRPPGLVGRVAAGGLDLVSGRDLAFTLDEAVALFGSTPERRARAERIYSEVGGWPAGLALAAEADVDGSSPTGGLLDLVAGLLAGPSAPTAGAARALAVLPYLTDGLARGLGVGDRPTLDAMSRQTRLVMEMDGCWRMAEHAAAAIQSGLAAATVADLRRRAATLLADDDPATAIDLLFQAGAPEAAADLMARHLSDLGPDRALPWLYQLPAEIRRRFPPVLSAGRATVDLDAASLAADERVRSATNDQERREALYALGSAHAHAGRLAAAAAAFEAASAPGSRPALTTRAGAWLTVVRWWAGDLAGAAAAHALAAGDPVCEWGAAEAALAAGDTATGSRHAEAGIAAAREETGSGDASGAACRSVLARIAWLEGDRVAARGMALAAYRAAAERGGFDLASAGPTHAAVLVAEGRTDEALAVIDLVERRIGRHDAYSTLQAQLVRLAVAVATNDADAADHARRRVGQLRQLGFAPVEAVARQLLAPLTAGEEPGLAVAVLGPTRVSVDGVDRDAASWRSRKALEVLAYLALKGERGAHREEVIEAVWPDRPPENGRMLLRTALSEVRRRLEPERRAGEPSRFLRTTADRLRIDAAVDLDAARALAKAGDARAALDLFRGELLEDMPYAEWAYDDRRAAAALERRLAARLPDGQGTAT